MSQQREGIDTYLLRVLDTVLTERSVTRAAVKLNQSQPAVSAALRRLRDITRDQILVRGKTGMIATEYGLRLLEPARNALREIERIQVQQHKFEPSTSLRCYRVGCPDYLNVLFMPTVAERFRTAAPNATLEFHSLGQSFDYEVALKEGKLDTVVGNWPDPPEHLRSSNLFFDEIVCLVSCNHSFARSNALTTDQYLSAPHIAPTPYSGGQRGAIDVHLARERLKRRVVVTLPYFNLAPYVLVNSDLVFTTTRLFADYYAKFLPLTVVPAPLDFPPMQYYQLWHERSSHSEEVRWLRRLVTDAMQSLTGPCS